MKKVLLLLITGLLTTTVLTACGDKKDTTAEEDADTETNETETNETVENEETETDSPDEDSDSSEESEEGETTDSDDSKGGFFEVTEEPQLELGVGDTGVVQTSIGTYELTLDDAELIGTELDGEATLLEELILLNLTFKNTSDDTLVAEDLMYNLGITTSLEGSNSSDNSDYFESIEVFEGEIAPGEEKQAQFIADVKTSDEYYFRPDPGVVANGTHNDLLWTITDEEARDE